jgi:hypothetical protein
VEQSLVSLSTPVTGTEKSDKSLAIIPVSKNHPPEIATQPKPSPPPTKFPKFEGENPRLWKRAAEKYFRLFSMDDSHRVEYATMHFTSEAAMWLNTIEHQLENMT